MTFFFIIYCYLIIVDSVEFLNPLSLPICPKIIQKKKEDCIVIMKIIGNYFI